MFVARNVEAGHKDLIHDVAYDFYGRRFATCSSDQSVKVIGIFHCLSLPSCISFDSFILMKFKISIGLGSWRRQSVALYS